MSNHDPYSDSPSLLVGFGTTKVYSADRSRHCHGINYAQNPPQNVQCPVYTSCTPAAFTCTPRVGILLITENVAKKCYERTSALVANR
jgi:hypothetical protein